MKVPDSLAVLAAALLLVHPTFAAKPPPPSPVPPPLPISGALVLDYYSGGNGSQNFGVAIASFGTVYASGTSYFPAYPPATWHGLVLGSGDAGGNWTTVLDVAPPGFSVGFGGIAGDAAGNLYVAGLSYDYTFADPYDHGIVLRSADGGVTWTMVDDFSTGQDSGDPPTGITVDAAGDVYVTEVTRGAGTSTWTIRKGVGGTSFSTVDAVAAGHAQGIYAHPTAGLFAVGNKVTIVKGGRISIASWLVRRSTNGGASWSDVDTFQLLAGNGAHANGIGVDAFGNLYVVGRAITTSGGNNIYHWLVRKSTNGGNSWSTVDDFVPSSNSAEARGFAVTPNGDRYVTGIASSSTGNHWIVRKNSGGTGTWSTIDDFQYVAGATTEPRSIVADAAGNLFIGGFGWGPSGSGTHWLIKKY